MFQMQSGFPCRMRNHTMKKRTRSSGLVGFRTNPAPLSAHVDLVVDLVAVVDLFEAGLSE
jgi:hypothetical protein